MTRFSTLLAVFSAGCFASIELPDTARVSVVEVRPAHALAIDEPIEIELSGPILPPEGRWPIAVERADGREIGVNTMLVEPSSLWIFPAEAWPAGDRLTLRIEDGLTDQRGWPIETPSAPFVIETERPAPIRSFSVEGPRPGSVAPRNLRTVVLATQGIDPPMHALTLRAEDHTVQAPIAATDALGRWLAELPADAESLWPGRTYRVDLEGLASPSTASEGEIRTGTVVDATPPSIRIRELERAGARARLTIEATEPVLASGSLTDPAGARVRLIAPLVPLARVELTPESPLAADTVYRALVEARDLAGNGAAPLEVGIATLPDVQIGITEVVTTPLHDWNDAADGVPLDAAPGLGPVTDSDEWVELVNRSGRTLDLTVSSLVLRVIDATPTEHDLAVAPALHFGRGGSTRAWGPGEALVVRPRGSMAQREVTVEVRWGDAVLDRVRLGRAEDADHAGGPPPDLEHEAIARDVDGQWRWCGATPGDPQSFGCLR